MTKITRIPRPQGVSLMNKERRKEYIVKQYVNNGMMYLNQHIPIPDFSNMLNIDIQMIVRIMSEQSGLKASILGSEDGLAKAGEALAEMVIFWGLQDKHTAQAQLGTLLTAQGASYTPFVTAEVNKALSNTMTATKNLMEAFKTIIPADTLSQREANKEGAKGKVLYIEDAIEIIQKNNISPLNSSDTLDALRASYLHGTPNIIAMQQADFKPESLGGGNTLQAPDENLIESKHDTRREIEEGLQAE